MLQLLTAFRTEEVAFSAAEDFSKHFTAIIFNAHGSKRSTSHLYLFVIKLDNPQNLPKPSNCDLGTNFHPSASFNDL